MEALVHLRKDAVIPLTPSALPGTGEGRSAPLVGRVNAGPESKTGYNDTDRLCIIRSSRCWRLVPPPLHFLFSRPPRSPRPGPSVSSRAVIRRPYPNAIDSKL